MAMPKAKEIVSSNSVVFFSKSYFPFCVNVKQLLHQLGASFKAIELNQESDGQHIGGCDSVPFFLKSNDLISFLNYWVLKSCTREAGPRLELCKLLSTLILK